MMDREKIDIKFEDFPFQPDRKSVLNRLAVELHIIANLEGGVYFNHDKYGHSYAQIHDSYLSIWFVSDKNHWVDFWFD